MTDWRGLGIRPGTFYLPRQEHLNSHWPIIACDQYTSQPDIWKKAEQQVAGRPSTLRLIVPEAFLEDTEAITARVQQDMAAYLVEGVLEQQPEGFVLVERETQSGKRIGLVITIDLDEYDYQAGSTSLIRATEETVLSRIPPRQQVRKHAAVELSHVLLLVDDPQDALLGPLYQARDAMPPLYDIDLLMDGGHVRGWLVARDKEYAHLSRTLERLKAALKPGAPLFAVGDGNHSLAAAKAHWESIRGGLSFKQQETHPARFATVELINLHSEALLFEPIHRVVFDTTQQAVLDVLAPLTPERDPDNPDITLVGGGDDLPLRLPGAKGRLVTAAVQQLLDDANVSLDYVHGVAAARDIAVQHQGVGILMPDFQKDLLFPTVQKDGRLPRKTFSMGEANEKRFYLEAKAITE